MALTVNPAVSGTRSRWILHSAGFVAGAFAGALVSLLLMLVVVLALSSVLPRSVVVGIGVAAIAWAALHDLGLPLRLPYRRQQVPEWFRSTFSPGTVATAFGFQLGVGFLTLFTYSAHVAVLVALPFLPSLAAMVSVVATFALAKAIVLAATFGTESTEELTQRFEWSAARTRLLRLTTAAASILVAAALVAT
jgi:hypothetical protein